MSITSETLSQDASRGTFTLTVTSSLSNPAPWFHWYLDGVWLGRTRANSFTVAIEPGQGGLFEAVDTQNDNFDPFANAPRQPSSLNIYWPRVITAQPIAYYLVLIENGAGTYLDEKRIPADPEAWDYEYRSRHISSLEDELVVSVSAVTNMNLILPVIPSLSLGGIAGGEIPPAISIAHNSGDLTLTFSEAT